MEHRFKETHEFGLLDDEWFFRMNLSFHAEARGIVLKAYQPSSMDQSEKLDSDGSVHDAIVGLKTEFFQEAKLNL